MIVWNTGDFDGDDLNFQLKGEETMDSKIQELLHEVEVYKQAIKDAKDALASAEMELDETLDAQYVDEIQ